MPIRKTNTTVWKNAKMMIIFKKGNTKDLKNYIPIYQTYKNIHECTNDKATDDT